MQRKCFKVTSKNSAYVCTRNTVEHRALYIFNTCIQYDLRQAGYAAAHILVRDFRYKESKNANTIDYEILPNIRVLL
jgi:hypothetical protein